MCMWEDNFYICWGPPEWCTEHLPPKAKFTPLKLRSSFLCTWTCGRLSRGLDNSEKSISCWERERFILTLCRTPWTVVVMVDILACRSNECHGAGLQASPSPLPPDPQSGPMLPLPSLHTGSGPVWPPLTAAYQNQALKKDLGIGHHTTPAQPSALRLGPGALYHLHPVLHTRLEPHTTLHAQSNA